MNYFIFNTGGDWDSTTLYNNGEEFLADQLFLELQVNRDFDGNPLRGGVGNGGSITAYAQPQNGAAQYAIFPGKVDFEMPAHKLTVVNATPQFAFEFTQVIFDNVDVTAEVVEIQVNIDAVNNEVSGYIVLYKPHFISADEVATYSLL
jgi:hypothetical protein